MQKMRGRAGTKEGRGGQPQRKARSPRRYSDAICKEKPEPLQRDYESFARMLFTILSRSFCRVAEVVLPFSIEVPRLPTGVQ